MNVYKNSSPTDRKLTFLPKAMADDEGLYDDLDDALIIQTQEKDLEKQRIDEVAKLAVEKKLKDEINRLQAQISELTAKNQNLEANIKYLLETSREELKR